MKFSKYKAVIAEVIRGFKLYNTHNSYAKMNETSLELKIGDRKSWVTITRYTDEIPSTKIRFTITGDTYGGNAHLEWLIPDSIGVYANRKILELELDNMFSKLLEVDLVKNSFEPEE
jgi:hypothetical protein